QDLEHPIDVVGSAGPALHREAHGLVKHEHVGVLVERDRAQEFPGLRVGLAAGRARPWLIELKRGNTHRLPSLQSILRTGALAVHSHLAFPDDALDVGEGEPGEPRLEEAVEPHAGFVRRDGNGLHASRYDGPRCLSRSVLWGLRGTGRPALD